MPKTKIPDDCFKLTPADLTFLYDDCKACFWHKIHGTPRPYTPFPTVFNRIDKAMKAGFNGLDMGRYDSALAEGKILAKSFNLRSRPIYLDGDRGYVMVGRPDAIIKFPDQSIYVIDFKTSSPNDKKLELYSRQLHAGGLMFLAPDGDLKPREVKGYGLISIIPEEFSLEDGCSITVKDHWDFIPQDKEWFGEFIHEVMELVYRPQPDPDPKCLFCRARQGTSKDLGGE